MFLNRWIQCLLILTSHSHSPTPSLLYVLVSSFCPIHRWLLLWYFWNLLSFYMGLRNVKVLLQPSVMSTGVIKVTENLWMWNPSCVKKPLFHNFCLLIFCFCFRFAWFYLCIYLYILHSILTFLSLLYFQSLLSTSPLFHTAYPLLLSFFSGKSRPPMYIILTWHLKL